MIRLAANLTTLFTELPVADRFGAAADAGFGFVEMQSVEALAPARLAALLRAAGLEMVLFNAPAGTSMGLAGGETATFDDSIDGVLRYVEAAGVPRVHVMSGRRDAGENGPAADNPQLVANLARAARRLAEAGAAIMLEALNPLDAPNYRLGNLADAALLQDRVGEANVRLQFDSYHMQKLGLDPAAEFAHYASRVGHVQMAGVPDRGEPDREGVPAADILAMLETAGYDGFVGCEYHPRKTTLEGLAWAAPWGIGARA
jgi:hydroxypyruvate isomerase